MTPGEARNAVAFGHGAISIDEMRRALVMVREAKLVGMTTDAALAFAAGRIPHNPALAGFLLMLAESL